MRFFGLTCRPTATACSYSMHTSTWKGSKQHTPYVIPFPRSFLVLLHCPQNHSVILALAANQPACGRQGKQLHTKVKQECPLAFFVPTVFGMLTSLSTQLLLSDYLLSIMLNKAHAFVIYGSFLQQPLYT